MNTLETPATGTPPPKTRERRESPRKALGCDLWMIDHDGSTMLRCRCLDAGSEGMRLRVPLGYGVAEGQRYELRSHRPGDGSAPEFGLVATRWATVVRIEFCTGSDDDHVDVGVVLDESETPRERLAGAAGDVVAS